jgi:transcriptional regulator with XRE-family HTH domain
MSSQHRARGERPPPTDLDTFDLVYRDSFDLVDLMGTKSSITTPADEQPFTSETVRKPSDASASVDTSKPESRPVEANDHGNHILHVPGGPPPGWRHPRSDPPTQEPLTGLVTFGLYARRSRYFVHVSQERLSGDSGISQSMISRMERGLAPGMRMDHLVMLSEQLGRAMPLGFCPHEHRCVWQPIQPRNSTPELDEAARRREKLIELGLDHPFGKLFPD